MYALETKKLMRLPGILFVVTEYALTITNWFFFTLLAVLSFGFSGCYFGN